MRHIDSLSRDVRPLAIANVLHGCMFRRWRLREDSEHHDGADRYRDDQGADRDKCVVEYGAESAVPQPMAEPIAG